MERSAVRVPVTFGCIDSTTVGLDGCHVTHARFPPDALLESHIHERPTLAVMLNGSFDLAFAGTSFACPPASVSIEPAGERHSNRMNRRGAEVLVVQPDPEAAELWRPFAALLTSTAQFRHGGVRDIAARVAGEIARADAFSGLAVQALTLELMIAAARVPPASRDLAVPPWLLRAQEMLHDDALGRLDMETVACAAGVHAADVASAFRRHFGMSLGTYARQVRLGRVADRLIGGDEPLAAIAAEQGFADQSHLTRAFKRHYGTTPQRFREQRRRDSSAGHAARRASRPTVVLPERVSPRSCPP